MNAWPELAIGVLIARQKAMYGKITVCLGVFFRDHAQGF
jgi:hypothetical protein